VSGRETIVCASANPALDRRVRLAALRLGKVNRASQAEAFPGGKAAHVAMAAQALGARAVWIGFLGGALGEECARGLKRLGIEVHAVRTAAQTRANLEVIENSRRITEILEPGATPTLGEREEMLEACEEAIENRWPGALMVISGSLPAGMDANFYVKLIRAAHRAGAEVFLDTSGDALARGIKAEPELVKPNRAELEAILRRKLRGKRDVIAAARKMIERGAKSVAVTMGSSGLVWVEEKDGPAWIAVPPKLEAVSTVGCGDTTLAGFAVAQAKGLRGEAAVRFATACGAANCLAAREGQISRRNVEALIPRIKTKLVRGES